MTVGYSHGQNPGRLDTAHMAMFVFNPSQLSLPMLYNKMYMLLQAKALLLSSWA
jgi:hypothetical protein